MYVHGLLRGLGQGLLLRRLKDVDRLPGEAEEALRAVPHNVAPKVELQDASFAKRRSRVGASVGLIAHPVFVRVAAGTL
ncbi:hypothetical protein E4U61_000499 [Claviceps capensis]|nr:hypothetical protein E4U61_000499 [Claviceps capensis]